MKSLRPFLRLGPALAVALLFWGCGRTVPLGDRIKVAGVYPGSLEDPETAIVHQALVEADQEMMILYQPVENVLPSEMDRILRDYVEKGYDLIFGNDRGAEEAVRRVARDHPEVAFCFNSRFGSVEPNFSVFSAWVYEPAYLCGLLAARLSESGRVGAVGSPPHPALNASLNAFRAGVRGTDPGIGVEVVLAGSSEEAGTETARLIDAGADYIFAASPGAIEVCREKRVPVFGYLRDWYMAVPNTLVTGAVWDMGPTVAAVVEEVKDGSYQARDLREWSMMAKGGAYLAPYHSFEARIPYGLKEEIDEIRRAILSGLYRVPADEYPPARIEDGPIDDPGKPDLGKRGLGKTRLTPGR